MYTLFLFLFYKFFPPYFRFVFRPDPCYADGRIHKSIKVGNAMPGVGTRIFVSGHPHAKLLDIYPMGPFSGRSASFTHESQNIWETWVLCMWPLEIVEF